MPIATKAVFDSFDTLRQGLDNHRRLFFTRFGDGEIFAMMGMEHRNYATSPGLVKELRESFRVVHPQYLMALVINYPYEKKMAPGLFAPHSRNAHLQKLLSEENLLIEHQYENAFVFHYIAVFYPQIMRSFLDCYVRPRKKMFIGCTDKQNAEKLYGAIDCYVNVPARSAYNSINRWWPKVEDQVGRVDLVIPSAGAASNVISKRLWHMDAQIHLLDIGSLIDAVEGKRTRIWLKVKGHAVRRLLPEQARDPLDLPARCRILAGECKYLYRRYVKRYLKEAR